MNLSEFKAWFEGFTESMDSTPNEKQWKRIRDRVKEIKDAPPTSYPVFVDRYRDFGPWWTRTTWGTVGGQTTGNLSMTMNAGNNLAQYAQALAGTNTGREDWQALGRADAESIATT